MSSSDEDDDSSYESVAMAEERIGGMLHEAVLEVNEEIAVVARPASPRLSPDNGEQKTTTAVEETSSSIQFRRSSLRAVFPPFFFPTGPPGGGGGCVSGGSGGLSCPVQSFHLNRRRTWGSAIAHRLVMESVVPATLFRAVVVVFHLWLEESGGVDRDCDDKVASAPMEEIVSYIKFLAKECGIGGRTTEENQALSHYDHGDDRHTNAEATDSTELWHHFFPSLVEASKQTVSGKMLIRSMEDIADPMALEIDLEACRSITLGEWKAFLGIPREVPSADQLADGSSDFVALLEWWNSQLLHGENLRENSNQQPLYDFLMEYCQRINASVMKYTCRGLSSSIGCVHRRRCGATLKTLGHPASARTAFYNGTMGRVLLCDLVRTNGKMKLGAGFVRNGCHSQSVIAEVVSTTEKSKDANVDVDDVPLIEDNEKNNKAELLPREELLDLFPSDDDDDNFSDKPQRTFRRIKRGLALSPPGHYGIVRTSISNAEKKLRCESEDDANYCEVSRAWADARDTFGIHSDEDDRDGL